MREVLERAQRQLEALRDAADALQGLRATATSPGGVCEAEVDLSGALVGLRLRESATRLPPSEVGELICATAARAAQLAAARRAEVLAGLAGALTARTG